MLRRLCLSKCFRMIVIHVCSGWNFGLSLRETHARYRCVQCRTRVIETFDYMTITGYCSHKHATGFQKSLSSNMYYRLFRDFYRAPLLVIKQEHKKHNTIKLLIGITLNGAISFFSKCWGGRATDKYITHHIGFLNKMEHGDINLVD